MIESKGNKPGQKKVSAWISDALHREVRVKAAHLDLTFQEVIPMVLAKWVSGDAVQVTASPEDQTLCVGMLAWKQDQQESGQDAFWAALIEAWRARGQQIQSASKS
jgi:hypothetical protein